MTTADRLYTVWIKGQKISTAQTVSASNKISAQIRFATRLGIKSYETDAMWIRPRHRTDIAEFFDTALLVDEIKHLPD